MDTQGTLGWLVPVWILGAPLLSGIIELMRTPAGGPRTAPAAGTKPAYVPPSGITARTAA